jgi:hypothetical protein
MEALDNVLGDEIVSIGKVIASSTVVGSDSLSWEDRRISRKTGASSLEGEMNV